MRRLLNSSDVYKSSNHVRRTSRFQHGVSRPYPNDHEHKLAVIPVAPGPCQTTRTNRLPIGRHWSQTCNGDCHCPWRGYSRMRHFSLTNWKFIMPVIKTAEWQARKGKEFMVAARGSQLKHLKLARASKRKLVESSARHSAMIRHHRTSLAVRSIIFITTTTDGSDMGEISKILVCWILAKYAIQTAFVMIRYEMH